MTEATGRTRLLFVDDEESILLTLGTVLKKQGFDVTTAATVRDALTHINSEKFDVLLCDLNIEKPADGFMVISAMRYAQPLCISFILTAYPSFENAMAAIQTQVDDFFTKPMDVDILVKKINEKLESKRSRAPVPFKRVAAVLRENCADIVAKVASAMKSDPLTSAARLSRQSDNGDISKIMDALIEYVDVGQNGLKSDALKLGAEHGRGRKKQGYDARMMVREFQLISERIFELMASEAMPPAPVGLTADLMKLTKGLNALTTEALKPYLEVQQARQSSHTSK
jgi:DNA-binding response OmpR family regulator